MHNKKFLDKEGKDFATILSETLSQKEVANAHTNTTPNTTTKAAIQQPPQNRGYGGTIPSFSDSHRGGISQSEALVALGFRTISLPTQRFGALENSQGGDGEASRDSERKRNVGKRDTRDSEREARNSERDIKTSEREARDSEAEQRARQLEYIDQELQNRNRAIQSETRQFLQLCNVKTKFTQLENEEFLQHSKNYDTLQTKQKILQQKVLKAYKDAGAIIYTPNTKKPKHK